MSTDNSKTPTAPAPTSADADSDPDFDDLDDVLDQFSANAPTSSTTQSAPVPKPEPPSASGPGRPADDVAIPAGPQPNESEDDFIARLTAEMSSVMTQFSQTAGADADASPEDLAKMGKELEDFTYKMEQQGIQPEDLLKAILGEQAGTQVADGAHEDRKRRESEEQSKSRSPETKKSASTTKSKSPQPSKQTQDSAHSQASFEETIRRTMARLDSSSAAATSSAQTQSQQKSEEDLLADMLKGLATGEGGGEDNELSKMFLGMMEQLTNKDMLYEPMSELHTKFPKYLADNKSKLPPAEYTRYEKQQTIVGDIVKKFESPGFKDDDPECREYIWEKMQEMQGQGAPPEELVSNPLPGMDVNDKSLEEGCPTQ